MSEHDLTRMADTATWGWADDEITIEGTFSVVHRWRTRHKAGLYARGQTSDGTPVVLRDSWIIRPSQRREKRRARKRKARS
jgi:hypothetical protein